MADTNFFIIEYGDRSKDYGKQYNTWYHKTASSTSDLPTSFTGLEAGDFCIYNGTNLASFNGTAWA